MDSYEVIMTPDAIEDLTGLRDYISGVLLAPDTALSYIQFLRKKISSLEYMPGSIAPVQDEPWHSMGIRKIIAKNFYIYYRIDEDNKIVYVLNVIYSRRDQLRILEKL